MKRLFNDFIDWIHLLIYNIPFCYKQGEIQIFSRFLENDYIKFVYWWCNLYDKKYTIKIIPKMQKYANDISLYGSHISLKTKKKIFRKISNNLNLLSQEDYINTVYNTDAIRLYYNNLDKIINTLFTLNNGYEYEKLFNI